MSATTASAAVAETTLRNTAAPATTAAHVVGSVPGSQRLTVEVWLRPDVSGASRYVSTPGGAVYHHYLSPNAYTSRFGASGAAASAVRSWLAAHGLSAVWISRGRDYVSASGPVSTIESTFAVTMNQYSVPGANGGSTVIQANDRDVSVPSALAGDILSVTGLNTTQPRTFHTATSVKAASTPTCSRWWAQHVATVSPAVHGLTQASLPVCGYSSNQLRKAYGITYSATGAHQTIALIEVGVPTAMLQTLTDYATSNGLPPPQPGQFREQVIGQGNACGNYFDIEEQLDSEAAYAMAPGANQLMVDGDSCDTRLQGVQPLFNAELAVLNGNGSSPSASIESNAWGITGGEAFPRVYADTAHAIDLRAAAEGVGMYFSSGDSPGVSVPASDPYSLAVGGTTFGIGQTNNRLFETGWSNDDAVLFGTWQDFGIGRDAAGGGASLLYGQPAYQRGVVPTSMSTIGGRIDRTVPDVSADADPNTGILQGVIEPDNNGNPGRIRRSSTGERACPPHCWPASSPMPSKVRARALPSSTRCSTDSTAPRRSMMRCRSRAPLRSRTGARPRRPARNRRR